MYKSFWPNIIRTACVIDSSEIHRVNEIAWSMEIRIKATEVNIISHSIIQWHLSNCNTCNSFSHFGQFFFLLVFFSVRLLSVLRGHSVLSSPPQRPMTSDFLSQIVSITFIFLSWFLRKSQYFPFWMFSSKQGHYWYHFSKVFGMTRSLTVVWIRDLPHSKPVLYHEAIEEAVLWAVYEDVCWRKTKNELEKTAYLLGVGEFDGSFNMCDMVYLCNKL